MSKNLLWLSEYVRGKTFDDFIDPPGWGRANSRKDISLRTLFSEHIPLNTPIVSANMDTVTGARMAIAQARKGGVGIIHRYLSIEDQCAKAREVKRAENFVIEQPYEIAQTALVTEARDLMNKYKVGGLVVVDSDHKLVGMLSGRDVRFCDGSILVTKRMTPFARLVFMYPGVSFREARECVDAYRLEKLPLVDNKGRLAGLITAKDIQSIERYPLANKDENGQLIVGAAIGATGDYLERAAELVRAGVDVLVLDIANAQSDPGLNAVTNFRKQSASVELVVGNIAIPMAVERYRDLGVNGFKVGLGPGSACTTRRNTNIGVPQGQAIFDCACISGVPVIADGGIRRHGHIVTALLLGASSVMIGGEFGGTEEAPGKTFRKSDGQTVKRFRGMASREAMHEKFKAEEFEDPYAVSSRISPEGIEKDIPYKGSVVPMVDEMIGHIASAVSYLGGLSLEEAKKIFWENPEKYIIQQSLASQKESFDR